MEDGVVVLNLHTGSLKTRSRLEPPPRCEPITYQPISKCLRHCVIAAGAYCNTLKIYIYILYAAMNMALA